MFTKKNSGWKGNEEFPDIYVVRSFFLFLMWNPTSWITEETLHILYTFIESVPKSLWLIFWQILENTKYNEKL